MRRPAHTHHPSHTQRGVVLAVSLIFLLLMTILGVSTMQSTALQERMAGNQRDRNLAFQAAEAALRTGEAWLQSVPPSTDPSSWAAAKDATWDCTTDAVAAIDADLIGLYTSGDNPLAHVASVHIGAPILSVGLGGSAPAAPGMIYPITACAYGGSMQAVVILQTHYRWP